MKKHVVLAAGLAVLSTNAFATKARMEALGQNANRGSLFIQDNRNIFRNAAQVNSMKNYVVTEWGTANYATDDTSAAPKAEGGFFREAGAFSYGLYFGSDINNFGNIRTGTAPVTGGMAVGEAGFLSPGNKLDLFLAGDAGVVEWGVRLGYGANKDKASSATATPATFERKASNLDLGLGIIFGDLQAYTNLDIVNKSEGGSQSNDEWEGDFGWELGVNYTFMGYTAWVEYGRQGAEYTNNGATTNKPEWERANWDIGVGRTHEVSSSGRVYYSLGYMETADETKAGTVKQTGHTKSMPLTFGYEADATSWLTLRGSIAQDVNVFRSRRDGANTTDVAAGGTLNFGKLKVDGTIGTLNNANGAGEIGTLALDKLATRVAVHYWF